MHTQTGLKALPLSGLSISWCFPGIEMVQPYNFPEKHSSQVTSAGEERGEGSRTQEGGAGSNESFLIPTLPPVRLPRMASDEWGY